MNEKYYTSSSDLFSEPPQTKRRRKSPPTPLLEIDKEKMKESLFGNWYPKDSPHWQTMEGIEKPVHWNTEASLFMGSYCQCAVTKKYYLHEEMAVGDFGGQRLSMHKSVYEQSIGGKWVRDDYAGCYVKLESAHEAYEIDEGEDEDGKEKEHPIYVTYNTLTVHFFRCFISGKTYHRSHRLIVFFPEGGKHICRAHWDQKGFPACQSCGSVFHVNLTEIYEGARYCHKCARVQRKRNLIFKHDYSDYPRAIYSTIKRFTHWRDGDGLVWSKGVQEEVTCNRLYGAEVELELNLKRAIERGIDRFDVAKAIYECMGRDFVVLKEDGSLIRNGKYSDADGNGPRYAGFEIASAPAGLDIHRQRWLKLFDSPVFDVMMAWDCDTCGFHVHLSKDATTTLSAGRMLAFINHPKNSKFIWKIAGRSSVKFTKYLQRKVSDIIDPSRVINPDEKEGRDRSRRVAFNICNENTYEFRIFRGTVNPRHIIRNMEFCDSLVDFCNPCSRSIAESLDYRCYVDFVDKNRKRWPLLAGWFAYHQILTMKKITRPNKVNKEKLTIDITRVDEPEILVA
jgi:hypothetical protein